MNTDTNQNGSTPLVITTIYDIPFEQLNAFLQLLLQRCHIECITTPEATDEESAKTLKDKLANGTPEQQYALKTVTENRYKNGITWYLSHFGKTLEELIKMTKGLPWGPGMKSYVAEQNARMIYYYFQEQGKD